MKRAAAIFAFLVISTGIAHADRRVALVLGTDAYKTIRPLDNAVNDAQAIEEALTALDFEVFLETNRDLRRMRRALEDFREDAAGADVALVFYAGHGVEIAGENRLLPTDADASSLDALKASTLPLNDVRDAIAEAGKVGLIVLDACRNDPFGTVAADGRGAAALKSEIVDQVKPGFGRIGRAENILFSFSAAPGATAADGDGENSPFTSALIKYLGTDGLEIRSVLTLVQQEVYDLSRGGQLPYVENGLPQLFFASSQESELPERERLLLAMADVTPDLRVEVERLAAENNMPLAPLYAAMISSEAQSMSQAERMTKLADAASAFVETQTQIRTLSSADPAVTKLREEAEAELALGAFDGARAKLAQAATIDSVSRDTLKANYVERTVSEATTHLISGGTSRADLNYALAIESYRKANALFDEVSGDDLPEAQRLQQLVSLESLGDLYLTVGNLAEGRKAYERQQAVSDALVKADPETTAWQGSLAASTLKLGDVLRDQGDSAGALASYERGLAIRRALAEAHPDDSQALGLEASAYLQVGALHKLQGSEDKALEAYGQARTIAERLAAKDPGNDEVQATVARSNRLIGQIEEARAKFAAALNSYETDLQVMKKLAEADPADSQRQFDLAEAYANVGFVRYRKFREESKTYAENGDPEALASLKTSRDITRELIAADQLNTTWQRGLANTLERLGEAIYFADGNITQTDSDESRAAYEEAIAIREKLVQSDQANKLWVGDLVKAYENMATWYVFQSQEQVVIDFTKKAHQAALQLAELDPRNVEWQRNATLYHAKIAESYVQLKDYKSALDYEIRGLEYAIGVAKANPTMPVYFNDVTTVQQRVARLYWVQKDWKNYWTQNDVVLEQAQRNEQRFPKDQEALRHLYEAYVSVGDSWTKNEPAKALDLYRNSMVYAERAAALDPASPKPVYGIYNAQIKSAYVIEQQSDRAAAKAAYEAALATIDRVLSMTPQESYYQASRDHVLARLDIVEKGLPPPDFR